MIHGATVTQADSTSMGSITIDETLLKAANLYEGERVQIINITNGETMENYILKGEKDSGTISIKCGARRNMEKGDKVIVISYAFVTPDELKNLRTINIFPDDNNKIE